MYRVIVEYNGKRSIAAETTALYHALDIYNAVLEAAGKTWLNTAVYLFLDTTEITPRKEA